jgi:hypothetical protein
MENSLRIKEMHKASFFTKSVIAIMACLALFGIWRVLSYSTVPKMTAGSKSYETYFRIVANYTYKSATGPQPWTFNVVAGCGVSLTKYVTGDISGVSQRMPTLYALPTSDGRALMIEVVKACGGSTTENGRVPDDFFPAIVSYESADDLSLGMLYLSEDAYEGPLSRLTFHGATISAATKEEFETWMETDGKKNLISYLSSAEITPKGYVTPQTVTPRHIANPGESWKEVMPNRCYGVARLKMPENLQNYVRESWDPNGPRYWTMDRERAVELRGWLGRGKLDNPLGETLFNGHPFWKYQIWPNTIRDGWGTGLVTRKGRGSFKAYNSMIPGAISALPTEYFPVRMSEALPWLKSIDPHSKKFFRDAEIGDESKKGFFYCFSESGPDALIKHFLPEFDPKFQWGVFPAELHVDGQSVPNVLVDRMGLGTIFFDRDVYVLWMGRVLL